MKINKLIMAGIMAVAVSVLALDNVEIIDVAGRQRYPWNGLVDIDFELDSKATEPYMMKVTVFDNVGKTNLPVKTCYTENVSQKSNPCMVTKDTKRIVWDAAADLPDGFRCSNVLVTCQDMRTIEDANRYMVIDLSGGSSASSYPISYMSTPPAGGWTDEYKLTKLVLRRVEAGSFMMGSPDDEIGKYPNETYHKVKLTKPFYIGIFEMTTKQWSLVTGDSGSTRKPVLVTYEKIRGNALAEYAINCYRKTSYCWPDSVNVDASSFVGKLRSRCGNIPFDLPTEAQWEYATRGGCEKGLNVGLDLSEANLNEVGRNINNTADGLGDASSDTVTFVGCYMPNSLGLFDTIGNAAEWCVDAYTADLGTAAQTDPKGAKATLDSNHYGSAYILRVLRGGGYINGPNGAEVFSDDVWGATYIKFSPYKACRSAGRISNKTHWSAYPPNFQGGFRICCPAE